MKTEIIFLGPPASGKGTQTDRLSTEFSLPHIDTGKLLRAEIEAGSEEGKIAKGFMSQGQLVPADLVSKIIIKKVMSDEARNGYILDGFPRSIEQADILEEALANAGKNNFDNRIVVKLVVDENMLLDRIINRRMCKNCNKIFSLKNYTSDICDECGGELYQRSDDNEETAKKRFDTYNEQTSPLSEYYAQKSLLKEVDGNTSPEAVYQNILNVLNN
ncbi:MAG: adenylate kinase [Candidatus Gastranaerophilales bacterium]|nr:adenylate kinase [Candidatus Gastranaerophilales bacterium]